MVQVICVYRHFPQFNSHIMTTSLTVGRNGGQI